MRQRQLSIFLFSRSRCRFPTRDPTHMSETIARYRSRSHKTMPSSRLILEPEPRFQRFTQRQSVERETMSMPARGSVEGNRCGGTSTYPSSSEQASKHALHVCFTSTYRSMTVASLAIQSCCHERKRHSAIPLVILLTPGLL